MYNYRGDATRAAAAAGDPEEVGNRIPRDAAGTTGDAAEIREWPAGDAAETEKRIEVLASGGTQ